MRELRNIFILLSTNYFSVGGFLFCCFCRSTEIAEKEEKKKKKLLLSVASVCSNVWKGKEEGRAGLRFRWRF